MPEIIPSSVLASEKASSSTQAAGGHGYHHSTSSSVSSSPRTTSLIHSPSAPSSTGLLPSSRTHSNSPRIRPGPFGRAESSIPSQRTSLYSNPSATAAALSPPPPAHYLRGRARLSQSQESVRHLRKRSEIFTRANQTPGAAGRAQGSTSRSRSVDPEEGCLLFTATPTRHDRQRSSSTSEWPLASVEPSSAPATTTAIQGHPAPDNDEINQWSFLQTDPMGKEPPPRRTRHAPKGSLEIAASGGRGSIDVKLSKLEIRPRIPSNNSDLVTPKAGDYSRQWKDLHHGPPSETESPLSSTSNLSGYSSNDYSSRPTSKQGVTTSSPPARHAFLPPNSPLSTPMSPVIRAHLDVCSYPASACNCADQELRSSFQTAVSLPGTSLQSSTPLALPTSGPAALSEVQKRRRAYAFDQFVTYSEALPRPLPMPVQPTTSSVSQTDTFGTSSSTGFISSKGGSGSGSSAEESLSESAESSSILSRMASAAMDYNAYRHSGYQTHMSPQVNALTASPTSSASSLAPSSWKNESMNGHVVQPSRSVPNISAASLASDKTSFSLFRSRSGLSISLTSGTQPKIRKRGASVSASFSASNSVSWIDTSVEDERQGRNGFELAKDNEGQFAITRTVSCDDEDEYYAYSECHASHCHHHVMDDEPTINEQGDSVLSEPNTLKKDRSRRKNPHGLQGWKAKCPLCRFMASMKSIMAPSTPTNPATTDNDHPITASAYSTTADKL